ncbi:MAG: hypothetical protein U0R52_07970 [Solirubrobacterales bacterium]
MRSAGALLAAAGALLAAPGAAGAATAEEPVVLTGSAVPSLGGAAPGRILAYAWRGGWKQVPVQVDERALIDLGSAYDSGPAGVTQLTYTDAGTFVGADPVASLDANDEIAAMSSDAGAKANGPGEPAGAVAGSGVEVRITRPGAKPAYLYLFRGDGSRSPGAGRSYVGYAFNLASGDYKATYHLNSGPNPEDSTVTTRSYSQHFSDRWIDDGLRVRAGTASGEDILDRHKSLFAPGNCARSEDTFSAGEGAFIANRTGPVRAIRSYVGANSGPYTGRQHLFYRDREEITTFLRVHPIGSVMDFFDYSAAAVGMTYRSNLDPGGLAVDGVPDTATAGALSWEQVSGLQGALTQVHALSADFSPTVTSYYLDDANPGVTQCTGDSAAYASSGLYVTSGIPNTDPSRGAASSLSTERTLFFDPPGAGEATAQRHLAELRDPLRILPRRRLRLRVERRGGPGRGRIAGRACPAGEDGAGRLERWAPRARTWRRAAALELARKRGCWKFASGSLPGPGAYRVAIAPDDLQGGATSRPVRVRAGR